MKKLIAGKLSKKILLVGLIVCIVLFLPIVSAFEFDNVKSYDPITKEVTINNCNVWLGVCLIEGAEIGKAKLNTPLNVEVGAGYQKVAEFDIWAYQDYSDALKQFTFSDMNNGKKKINRDYDLKYLSYEDVEIDDYKNVEDGYTINGTIIYNYIKVGSHIETKEKWQKVNSADLKKNKNLTIGIFTNVQINDYVDWIPRIYGVEVEEWATWSASLETNLLSYYKLDEASGDFLDSVSTNDLITSGGITYGATGIINDAPNFDNSYSILGSNLTTSSSIELTGDFTYSVWVNPNNNMESTRETFWFADTGGCRAYWIDGSIKIDTGTSQPIWTSIPSHIGTYKHYLFTRTSSTYNLYLNGVIHQTGQEGGNVSMFIENIGGKSSEGTSVLAFDGEMDEIGIWSRALTTDEVTLLYNSGVGLPFRSDIVTMLNSPIDNYVTDTSEIIFNVSVSSSFEVDNVILYINGILNETNSSGVVGDYIFNKTFGDGNYNWSVISWNNENESSESENRGFTIDTITPTIVVENPTGTLDYGVIGLTETLNATFTDANLDSCWYNYNGTNITIDGCLTGVLNSTTFILEDDNLNMTIYANDTVGNVNATFIEWCYNLTEISQTYPTVSVESATETYTSNVSYNSSKYGVITGTLNINGTQYVGTGTGTGNNINFSANAIMPSISTETNLTAYWTIGLTDSNGIVSYNLTSSNVTISIINFSLCDSTNNVPFWNFTVYNETNLAEISSTFDAAFHLKQTGSTSINEFSFSDITGNKSQFDFCITPVTKSYTVDTNIKLTKTNYVDKFYNYESVILTNVTRENSLYMLPTADSTSYIIHVVDVSGNNIDEAEVRIQRYYPGSSLWVTTEIVTTNYIGESIGHLLSEDSDYRFLVYQDGVSIYNSTATKIICETTPCTVTLVIPITVGTGIEDVEDLTSTLTFSSTTNIFTYTYSDTSSNFDLARLYVLRVWPSNATLNIPCNQTKTTSSGIITCDISGQVNGTYRADGYITRDDTEFLDKRLDGTIGTNIFNAMGNDGIFWGIFVFIGIIMIGINRPSMAIIFGMVALFILGIIGMINIGVISLVAITSVGIILLMRVGKE